MLSKVASLIHDDVLDDADTRRGIGLLNFLMDDMVYIKLWIFLPTYYIPFVHYFLGYIFYIHIVTWWV